MKYRDKLIKYFEEAPEGAVIVANDMYEKGFTKMSHDAFFRAVERLKKWQWSTGMIYSLQN